MKNLVTIIWVALLYSCTMKNDTNILRGWDYKIEYGFENLNDSAKEIGRIVFIRTEPVKDDKKEKIYQKAWYPKIAFDIFNISDLEYCKQESIRIQTLASCLGNTVGGDLVIVGEYIFLNRNVCLDCIGTENNVDYCRPVANKVLTDLDLTKSISLEEIDRKIRIQFKKASN